MPSKITSKEEQIYSKIGKRIQQLRNTKNMTQEDIAGKTGLAAKYVGFIEQGRKRPRIHTLVKISEALNCDIKELF